MSPVMHAAGLNRWRLRSTGDTGLAPGRDWELWKTQGTCTSGAAHLPKQESHPMQCL